MESVKITSGKIFHGKERHFPVPSGSFSRISNLLRRPSGKRYSHHLFISATSPLYRWQPTAIPCSIRCKKNLLPKNTLMNFRSSPERIPLLQELMAAISKKWRLPKDSKATRVYLSLTNRPVGSTSRKSEVILYRGLLDKGISCILTPPILNKSSAYQRVASCVKGNCSYLQTKNY